MSWHLAYILVIFHYFSGHVRMCLFSFPELPFQVNQGGLASEGNRFWSIRLHKAGYYFNVLCRICAYLLYVSCRIKSEQGIKLGNLCISYII
jgi:hypothetical protein